jgi:putative transposase
MAYRPQRYLRTRYNLTPEQYRIKWGLPVDYPRTIRVDNGPEFVSKELDLWAYMKGVTLDFSRPGKPTDNAFIESFNGKFRAECLNANWFLSLDEARAKCEAWRRDYNEVRPHSAIGNKTPIELHRMAASPASRSSEEARIL